MKKQLINYFKASFPAIAIQTTEEFRAVAEISAAAKEAGRDFIIWSATEGAKKLGADSVSEIQDSEDLALFCRNRFENSVIVLRDPHTWPLGTDMVLCRTFREFLSEAPLQGNTVIILSPDYTPHPTVARLVTMVEFSLPTGDQLREIATNICETNDGNGKYKITDELIRALSGLSTTEAENALSLSIIETGDFDPLIIYREKTQAIKRSGLLEIMEPDPRGLDAIGGLDALKEWIVKRRRAFTPEAEKFGLPSPKGILLVGAPGSGKSLCGKAIGTALGVPTIKLDMGSLFNSLVGESEARTREALKLAEAMAPCVLLVDEIDKGLAGASGSGDNDSGVTKRVFGTILTWLQERRRPVFLVATANQVQGLPPELLRKGRFDELFAVDLPDVDDRKAILKIHLTKRNRDPKKFDLDAISKVMEEFTGSEIETVLDEGMFEAFDQDRDLNSDDLVAAAKRIIPLAQTAKEKIEAIREWAKTRARFASSPKKAEPLAQVGKRKIGMK